ncbi:hypothetical protein HELRODRAFT_175805 [Helobdella robusta]|uniref:Uncharacterized protein n=1 Tax=Helobdella robusta TaxID=6412 RepID=T1F9P1_HELRO|nr:hypothetical protein HELRODRAFT_175805 [Helobdella robusta]ESO00388.1 hypothetical protein HELRODRAFT_175805 [Helobdella robusta]
MDRLSVEYVDVEYVYLCILVHPDDDPLALYDVNFWELHYDKRNAVVHQHQEAAALTVLPGRSIIFEYLGPRTNLTLRVIREKYQQKKNIKELSDDQKTKLKRIVEAVFANKLAIETVETGLEEPDIDVEKIKLNTGKHDIKKRKISDDNDTDDDDSPVGVHCNPLPLQAKKKAKISQISSDESIDSDVNLDESGMYFCIL